MLLKNYTSLEIHTLLQRKAKNIQKSNKCFNIIFHVIYTDEFLTIFLWKVWLIHLQLEPIMMMVNCFCGMIDQRKAFSLISSRDHCRRSSPSRISDMLQAGSDPAQNLSSGLVEWSCAVVLTTTPQCHRQQNCLSRSIDCNRHQWLKTFVW